MGEVGSSDNEMKIQKKIRFITVCLLILIAGCKQQADALPLERQCEHLSRESGVEYRIISGTVVRAENFIPHVFCEVDCGNRIKAKFFAGMKPLKDLGNTETFHVYSPFIPMKSFISKPLYMNKGGSYQFCAREIKNTNPSYPNMKFYEMDINTIVSLYHP